MQKLTRPLIEGICSYVKRGVPVTIAARAHGYLAEEWEQLMDDAHRQSARGLKRDLVNELDRAQAEFQSAQAMTITKHAIGFRDQSGDPVEGDWHAAEKALEFASTEAELERLKKVGRG